MNITTHIAKHFREVHFGVNWTWSNLKEHLSDVTWQQATMQVYGFNSIATLVGHINYYITIVSKVLEGETLVGNDKLSFAHPPIQSQEDWEQMLANFWSEVELFADLIEKLPEEQLWETFSEEKYGNYYRNLHGMIEHTHYHLGQIVLIKKIIQQNHVDSSV
jgi:uncharacterized damage-inducible protein DinB